MRTIPFQNRALRAPACPVTSPCLFLPPTFPSPADQEFARSSLQHGHYGGQRPCCLLPSRRQDASQLSWCIPRGTRWSVVAGHSRARAQPVAHLSSFDTDQLDMFFVKLLREKKFTFDFVDPGSDWVTAPDAQEIFQLAIDANVVLRNSAITRNDFVIAIDEVWCRASLESIFCMSNTMTLLQSTPYRIPPQHASPSPSPSPSLSPSPFPHLHLILTSPYPHLASHYLTIPLCPRRASLPRNRTLCRRWLFPLPPCS